MFAAALVTVHTIPGLDDPRHTFVWVFGFGIDYVFTAVVDDFGNLVKVSQ